MGTSASLASFASTFFPCNFSGSRHLRATLPRPPGGRGRPLRPRLRPAPAPLAGLGKPRSLSQVGAPEPGAVFCAPRSPLRRGRGHCKYFIRHFCEKEGGKVKGGKVNAFL